MYKNYRIYINAKREGPAKETADKKKAAVNISDLKKYDFYEKLKNDAENEINLLRELKIKPLKTSRIINYGRKQNISVSLPEFLHIYDPEDLFENFYSKNPLKKLNEGLFITSSRYEGTNIFKPDSSLINELYLYCKDKGGNQKFSSLCLGIHESADNEFMEKLSDKFTEDIFILTTKPYSLLKSAYAYKNKQKQLNLKFPQISALDPFAKNSKYGFALRNSLAFHLSQEMAVLYLSHNSSLASLIKKFKGAGKKVKIFLGKENYKKNITITATANANTQKDAAAYGTDVPEEYEVISKFIINSLTKENITIDNLLKLSNIRLKANENEIIRALSILEINSEIERLPGGIIKKI
ncbi:MAG: hypothetical protein EVJ48_00940 [Candidatus Acidulodesulfobacterium acidiphilum]|uniref:Uncharacterized protein n=1 Tax=Candidatus Acidulodesulfobacterium acidiphilum TaxID=2597224 RepID=A0A520XH47_9DELT|nr:MAG: hypothetical protein EVJ48_00940 [Candidatus Acidulodesulfobacterium acidiphilum]